MISVTSERHQAGRRKKEGRKNGQRPRQGETDRHIFKTVMSNWSDTIEEGRQETGDRDERREGQKGMHGEKPL